MQKTHQLSLAAAVALLSKTPLVLPYRGSRQKPKGVIMAGSRTPGIRTPGLAQRGGTVGDHMKRAPRDTKTKASVFHFVKGNPPRTGWTYRADRRNQAKVSRGARPVEVGKRVPPLWT